jgi:hypothetical protein
MIKLVGSPLSYRGRPGLTVSLDGHFLSMVRMMKLLLPLILERVFDYWNLTAQ